MIYVVMMCSMMANVPCRQVGRDYVDDREGCLRQAEFFQGRKAPGLTFVCVGQKEPAWTVQRR